MKAAFARWIAPATLIVALLLSQAGWAGLGLGEARVDSYLGQTLDARIALLQPSSNALETLQVSVASADDHARLGVSTEALVLGLSVTLDRSAEPPVIRLRSERAVRDPFVQVLVNARWSSGRMLREYTLFLDPPAVPVAPTIRRRDEPAAAEPAPAPTPSPEPSPAPEPQPERAPDPAPAPDPDPAAPTEPVVVERGETLWSIAAQWRPDQNLTMNQAMLAIFDRNPDAFMGNNVNRLRQGARLVLPDAEAARAISAAEASRRIREQTEDWRARRTAAPAEPAVAAADPAPVDPEPAEDAPPPETDEPTDVAPTGEETDAAPAEPDTAPQPEPTARLELSPPEEDMVAEAAAIGAEQARLASRLEGIESELATEGLAGPQTDRLVEQIRQAIDSADAGGFMVASEDLATLEQQLREAREARQAEQLARETEPEIAETDPATAPAAPPTATHETFFERWMWPIVAALVGLVLVGLLVMLLRRRADLQVQEPELAAPASPRPPEPQAVPVPPPAPEPVTEESHRDDVPGETAAPDREAAQQTDALAGILGRDEEGEDDRAAPDKAVQTMPPAGAEPEQDDDEAPDLAKLANRLDPDERDGDRVDEHALTLEDEDLDALFGADEDPTGGTERDRPEETGPLTLDFDLGEPEPDSADFDESAAAGEKTGDASPGSPGEDWSIDAPPGGDSGELEEPLFPDPERSAAPDPEQTDEVPWFEVDEPEQSVEDTEAEAPESMADAAPEAALSDEDAEVKLDLARAYISMEDPDSARTLLEEILADGSEAQRKQAQKLMDQLS